MGEFGGGNFWQIVADYSKQVTRKILVDLIALFILITIDRGFLKTFCLQYFPMNDSMNSHERLKKGFCT